MTREEIETLLKAACTEIRTGEFGPFRPMKLDSLKVESLCRHALSLMDQLAAKESAYNALLIAAEACQKGREEAERKVDELRKRLP